ncbi:hypothetical protein C8R44DRAFT_885923 [Mycena epipterygia]|nr:hypothetical protein C8R44DRAFT_885923 [Mycena epipterygia]
MKFFSVYTGLVVLCVANALAVPGPDHAPKYSPLEVSHPDSHLSAEPSQAGTRLPPLVDMVVSTLQDPNNAMHAKEAGADVENKPEEVVRVVGGERHFIDTDLAGFNLQITLLPNKEGTRFAAGA